MWCQKKLHSCLVAFIPWFSVLFNKLFPCSMQISVCIWK